MILVVITFVSVVDFSARWSVVQPSFVNQVSLHAFPSGRAALVICLLDPSEPACFPRVALRKLS